MKHFESLERCVGEEIGSGFRTAGKIRVFLNASKSRGREKVR